MLVYGSDHAVTKQDMKRLMFLVNQDAQVRDALCAFRKPAKVRVFMTEFVTRKSRLKHIHTVHAQGVGPCMYPNPTSCAYAMKMRGYTQVYFSTYTARHPTNLQAYDLHLRV
jgi:hypothetical protein